jgi:exopolysaccharide production protein ExoZ
MVLGNRCDQRTTDSSYRDAIMSRIDGTETDRLAALQALRAVAATMIVVLHAETVVAKFTAAGLPHLSYLEALPLGTGVDLFFVISGFVIVYASQKLFSVPGGRREFLRRRLIRIVPLYWTALTLRLLVLAAGATLGMKAFPDATAILASYSFIPYDCMGFGPEFPFPILDLGWTLNYEMFFYVLFAAFIVLRRDYAVLAVICSLFGVVVLATIMPSENVALRFWFRPITLEFAGGAAVALLLIRGMILPGFVRVLMIVAALLLWLVPVSWLGAISGPGFYGWPRFAIWGIGAILIIGAAVLGPLSFKSPWSKAIAGLGDSSYALYLLHHFVFLLVKMVLTTVSLPEILNWPLVFLTSALAIIAAALFHRYVESPVVLFLRKVTTPRAVVSVASS